MQSTSNRNYGPMMSSVHHTQSTQDCDWPPKLVFILVYESFLALVTTRDFIRFSDVSTDFTGSTVDGISSNEVVNKSFCTYICPISHWFVDAFSFQPLLWTDAFKVTSPKKYSRLSLSPKAGIYPYVRNNFGIGRHSSSKFNISTPPYKRLNSILWRLSWLFRLLFLFYFIIES